MNTLSTYLVVTLLAIVFVTHTSAQELGLLKQAHQDIRLNKYTNIDSMLVYYKGQLISEHYYGRFTEDTLHRTHSTFNSITSFITLIAMEQGLLSDDELVMPLVEQYQPLKGTDPLKQRITIAHLLNMSSGLACDESPNSNGPNHEFGIDEGHTPLKYAMEIVTDSEPGTKFQYCNANSFLLSVSVSAALKRAGREDIFKFADNYLMQPLGITHYRFTKSYSGQFLNGQGNGYFLPKDLAKLGLLVLNGGKWQGKTVISKASIERILEPRQQINWSFIDLVEGLPQLATSYSHQWYVSKFNMGQQTLDIAHSWGNGGQFIFIVPSLDAVIVFTGSNQGNFTKQKQPFDILYKYVLPHLMKLQ